METKNSIVYIIAPEHETLWYKYNKNVKDLCEANCKTVIKEIKKELN